MAAWPLTKSICMQKRVSEKIHDYRVFVLPRQEMWLRKIASKTRDLTYKNSHEYADDHEQLLTNCKAYNEPPAARYRSPCMPLYPSLIWLLACMHLHTEDSHSCKYLRI